MSFSAEFLLNPGRIFAHEAGHALIAALEQVPCAGIGYDRDEEQFCTLVDLPVRKEDYSEKNYLYLAAGVAAERVVYDEDGAQEGGEHDKTFFQNVGAPDFEKTVEKAQGILAVRKSTIRFIVTILKDKAKRIKGRLDCLPEIVDGKGKKYRALLCALELKDAVKNH